MTVPIVVNPSTTVTANTSIDLTSRLPLGRKIYAIRVATIGVGHAVDEGGSGTYDLFDNTDLAVITSGTPAGNQIILDDDRTGVTLGTDLGDESQLELSVELIGEVARAA